LPVSPFVDSLQSGADQQNLVPARLPQAPQNLIVVQIDGLLLKIVVLGFSEGLVDLRQARLE
jgi:hypothetical protein